jgi:hypothetical protein
MKKYKDFIVRAVALIAYEFFGTFGISSMWNVSKVQAALIAATVPGVAILRETAKGFIDDGKLDKSEQDNAIKAGEKASKQK